MRKNRILHVITSLSTGGAEAMLFKLIAGMGSKIYDPTVVVLMDSGVYGPRLRSMGIPVHTLDMQRGRPSARSIMKLRKIVVNCQPVLIQGWMYHGNVAAEIARVVGQSRAATVWNIRHSINALEDEKPLTRFLIRLGAKLSLRPARIIYNSGASAVQHECIGYSSRNRVVLPNGFDTDVFHFSDAARQRIRAELRICDDQFLIGTVARNHPIKDLQNLIQSAILVCRKQTNLRFVLVGSGVDSSQPDLNDPIEAAGLQSHIQLLGERTDIPEIMSAIDLFALPSRSEGFPNVIGEAMACERPCVATDVGDSAHVMGEYGIVVPPRDSIALSNAILKVAAATKEQRSEVGRKLRNRVVEQFALPQIVDQYQQLYRTVLGIRA